MNFIKRILGLGQPKVPLLDRMMLNLEKGDPLVQRMRKIRRNKPNKPRISGAFSRKVLRYQKLRILQGYRPGGLGASAISRSIAADYGGHILSRKERKGYSKRYGRPFKAYYN